jgi:hypothetical protein
VKWAKGSGKWGVTGKFVGITSHTDNIEVGLGTGY